jgi:NADPH:quinone reductase-like Zn-dependent oxidoreductase
MTIRQTTLAAAFALAAIGAAQAKGLKPLLGQVIRLALDGVSGPATGVLAATLSPRGTLVSFAAMSLSPMSISPLDVIFKPITMRGFYMAHPEFAAKLALAAAQAAKMLASGRLHIPVAATYPLSSIKAAVAHAQRGGKILLDVAGSST